MKPFAFPYPNLYPFIEGKSIWQYYLEENDSKNFDIPIKGWDYKASLKVSCKLSWDIKKTFSKANLDELIKNTKISFIAISGTGRYGVTRKKVAEFSLMDEYLKENKMIFNIESPNQANNIKFRLIIHTDGDEVFINNFKYKKGSILYDEFETLELEGNLARISLQSIKFEEKYKNAMWYVDFQADSLYENFNKTHTLFLNKEKKNLEYELRNCIFLKDAIKVDIIYTIMSSVFLNKDFIFDLNEDYDENTLGYQVKDWLKGFDVNNESELNQIQSELKYNPGKFRRTCQNIFCLNQEEI